ncbi:MAG: DNA topoisomerase IB [Chloroflexota bacterium]
MARLRHTTDAEPGIRRLRAGRGFSYRAPDGRPVDAATRRWIERLAIPPAWTDVWISPVPDGHLLATGRDARGRKQYRYHPEFRRRRDDHKFERLAAFGAALPRLRRQVAIDLRRRGLPREKVVAAVVALLDETSLRVGGEAYARANRSYGLTTLGSRHAVVSAGAVRLRFRGKSGRLHDVRLRDRRLARLVRRCQELPGQRLFRYEDESGEWQAILSDDVNAYIRAVIGDRFSAKDFRTWHGTLAAYLALADREPATRRHRARALVDAMDEAAARLGNTRTVARQAYIHPAVERAVDAERIPGGRLAARSPWRRTGETALLRLLGAAA